MRCRIYPKRSKKLKLKATRMLVMLLIPTSRSQLHPIGKLRPNGRPLSRPYAKERKAKAVRRNLLWSKLKKSKKSSKRKPRRKGRRTISLMMISIISMINLSK